MYFMVQINRLKIVTSFFHIQSSTISSYTNLGLPFEATGCAMADKIVFGCKF